MQSDEFRPFADYWPPLVDHATTNDQQAYVDKWASWIRKREQILAAQHKAVDKGKARRVLLKILLLVVGVAFLLGALAIVADWIFGIAQIPDIGWLHAWWQRGLFVIVSIIFLSGLLGVWEDYTNVDEYRYVREINEADRNWAAESTLFLAEAFRRAINRVLGPRGLVPFPAKAPDLVELSTDQIVQSETISYVRKFVAEHKTSAVGISGPRGSGKSTLMRAVVKDDKTKSISVLAATKYEPIDFLRRLAFAAASDDNRPDGASSVPSNSLSAEPEDDDQLATRRLLLTALASLCLVTGIGLIWADWSDLKLLSQLGPVALLGLLIVLVGIAILFRSLSVTQVQAVTDSSASQMAQRLATELRAELSEGREGKIALQITSLLGLERSASKNQTTRELTYGDLVDRLRPILQRFAEEKGSDGRTVVIIDELDKLPDVGSLTNVINAMKDLFHIERVHFLVSVSDEALAAFQLRGLQARDAFDSSFDEIVEIARLEPNESLAVLESRVTGFPDQLGLVCSVWAGGLPRDLIRATRACIDIARRSPIALPWQSIGKEFLAKDVKKRLNGITHQHPDLPAAELSGVESWMSRAVYDTLSDTDDTDARLQALRAFVLCSLRALEVVAHGDPLDEVRIAQLSSLSLAIAGLSAGEIGVARTLAAVRATLPQQ
jgi:AAA+ ATPase superfamily predicted ATPase